MKKFILLFPLLASCELSTPNRYPTKHELETIKMFRDDGHPEKVDPFIEECKKRDKEKI